MTKTTEFITKDSGERATFDSGMQRDAGKMARPDLIIPQMLGNSVISDVHDILAMMDRLGDPEADKSVTALVQWSRRAWTSAALIARIVEVEGPMLWRYSELLGRGASKYEARNWEKANGLPELHRFYESGWRHYLQWVDEKTDEDHAAGAIFNIRGYDWLLPNIEGPF